MKKLVLINHDFKDAYTGKIHKAGKKVEMTDERIAEVKGVNPDFVTVIGIVSEAEEEVIREVNSETDAEDNKSK
ncbi:MAG: hypothetical protein IJY94_05505 [Clostridia bacterium]|nr:hypothetical protein [Clostridia bacterium]